MSLTSFIKLFTPKDRIFYTLFEEVASTLSEMADTFSKAVSDVDPKVAEQYFKKIEDLEHKNDETTHKIFIELGRNFITPFDREDIHALATALDDVADYIWGSSKRMLNYSIDHGDNITKEYAQIFLKATKALGTAIKELRDMKDLRAVTESCVLINSLENEADELLDSAMMHLFNSSIDPVELIKKKDLYEMLEIVTDKCEDAANVVETIIIKYS
jgi:predicted phosphate transport protein (TIGR00153 family)